MLEMFKNKILALAKQAVLKVEEELSGKDGRDKKIAAVKYVVSHLPVPDPLRYIFGIVLSVFIDSAVEISVAYMNNREIVEE